MKNKWRLLLLVALFSFVVQGQSLEYFVDLTLENHPKIKAKNLQLQAYQNRESQITFYQDPVLSGAYNVVSNSMEKFNISLMQNFSWFGTEKSQKSANKHAVLSLEYGLVSYKKQIEITVSEFYFQLWETEELLKLQKQNVDMFSQLRNLANNKLASAGGTMVDVIRAELARENNQIEIDVLEQKKQALARNLNIISGRNPEEKIETEELQYASNSLENDLDIHPQIMEINHKIEESREVIKAIQKESLPVLGIGVEYMRMEPDRNEFMPMVSVSLPVFRKRYKAKIAEAELLSESTEYEKKWIENQLIRNRIRLKSEISQAEVELAHYDKQIQKAKQAKELLTNYYSSSGENFEEIVRLQQKELNYKISKIKTKSRVLQLLKEWEFLNNTSK